MSELNGSALPKTPEDVELDKVYQEFLQKCCEAGQLRYQITQIDGQKSDMEKQLEVTERSVKSSASKHRELQKAKFQKLNPPKAELEMAEGSLQ